MREIGISPRFSSDKFVPLQTKQRYSTRDISGEVFLTLFFRGFVPFLSLADFVSRDKYLQVADLQRLKLYFEGLVTATTSNHQNETNIKIRFNKLVSQFVNNKRYISLDKYTLSDEEDISYEMTVNKKNYDAVFYQVPNKMEIDTLALQEKVRNELLSKYTVEELIKPSEETTKEAVSTTFKIGMEMMFMKPVWFRICESYGKYSIVMYYDNEYNRSHGEDL